MAVAECWLRVLRVRCMVVANVDKARGTACREASPRGCEKNEKVQVLVSCEA